MSKYYRSVLNVLTPAFASTQSFNFDGVDDTFNLGNITALNGTNSGSFSMWLKLDATGILGLFNQYGSGSDRLIYAFIWLAGGRIDIYISGNLAFRVSSNAVISALSTGEWFNLVITYDGSLATSTDRVKVFINTNELTGNIGGAASSFFSSTTDFIIGHYPSGTYLNGNVDEFAIFTNTLSSSDVSSIYNSGVPNDISSLNPVAWYRMGENANYKSPQWLMKENSNKDKFSNYSFSFDGVDDFISLTEVAYSGAFTFSFWVKPGTFSGADNFILGDVNSNAHFIRIKSATQIHLKISSTQVDFTESGGNDIVLNTWQHLMITRDASNNVKAFRNGASFGSTGTLSGNFEVNAIGEVYSIGNFNFLGSIDELAIWTSDQSSNVSSIYNSGVPNDITSLSPVAHYRMGEEATFSTNWTIPDQVGGNDGTSSNMTIEDRIGDSPNSTNNAVSFNMVEADRETDVPS